MKISKEEYYAERLREVRQKRILAQRRIDRSKYTYAIGMYTHLAKCKNTHGRDGTCSFFQKG